MVGAGAPVFATMSYVVCHMAPDKQREEYVILNPVELAAILGETVEVATKAIDKLCAPDALTDTPGNEGRRLVKRSSFEYWVVNGKHYREIIDEEDQREKAAGRQRRFRERQAELASAAPKPKPKPKQVRGRRGFGLAKNAGLDLPGETAYVNGVTDGTIDQDTHEPIRDAGGGGSPVPWPDAHGEELG